jgi:hypothetical protein
MMKRRRLPKMRWAQLREAFIFGWSTGSIAESTGISRGTICCYAWRHNWLQDRAPGTEILRKEIRK